MEKKGETNVLAWIFFILLLLVVIGVTIAIIKISNQEEKKQLESNNVMDFYLIGKDFDSKKSIEIDYYLFSNLTETEIKRGLLIKDSYTEVKNLSNNDILTIYCGGRGYYIEKVKKSFTGNELELNSSKQDCLVDKIGRIDVEHSGKIEIGEKILILNITSESNYKNIGICTAWTPGVITIASEFEKTEKPQRLEKIVDKCFYTNVSLKDSFYEFNFTVKSNEINAMDKVTFYIFDNDLTYNENPEEWELLSESLGVNLGSNIDIIYEVGD